MPLTMRDGCFLAFLGIIMASFWTVKSQTNSEDMDNDFNGLNVIQRHDLQANVRELIELEKQLQDYYNEKNSQSDGQSFNYGFSPVQERPSPSQNFRGHPKRIMGPMRGGRKRDYGLSSEGKRIHAVRNASPFHR